MGVKSYHGYAVLFDGEREQKAMVVYRTFAEALSWLQGVMMQAPAYGYSVRSFRIVRFPD